MPTFVAAELDFGVIDETCSEHVGERVVFFVECENGSIGCS